MMAGQRLWPLVGAFFWAAAPACAGTITTLDLPGNFEQIKFGDPPSSQFYAQSVVPNDVFWSELHFRVTPLTGTGDLAFQVLVTGTRPDAGGGLGLAPKLSNILFNSGNFILANSATLTDIVVHPNLSVTPGTTLFFVLDAFSSGIGQGDASVQATEFNSSTDKYVPGEFVFFDTAPGDTFATIDASDWQHRALFSEDLAFSATFTAAPTPLPAALPLFGTGLGALGLLGWRRKKKTRRLRLTHQGLFANVKE